MADVIDSKYYEAQCYIRGTSLAAAYRYQNAVKSDYTYDESLWRTMIERVTIFHDNKMIFQFLDRTGIEA